MPLAQLWIHRTMTGVRTCRVSPFGHLWINACLRLPTAFRSLPRPSSAISARASSLCSYSLDLFGFHTSLSGHASTLVLSLCLSRASLASDPFGPFRCAPARNVLRALFSVQFSRNDLRPTPENDIVRKEEEPSVPFSLGSVHQVPLAIDLGL